MTGMQTKMCLAGSLRFWRGELPSAVDHLLCAAASAAIAHCLRGDSTVLGAVQTYKKPQPKSDKLAGYESPWSCNRLAVGARQERTIPSHNAKGSFFSMVFCVATLLSIPAQSP